MIINTDTLKNIARQIIASHNTVRQNDMEFKKNYIRARVDLILKQLDTIRAIAPAFNMLKSAEIKLVNKFFTEGYYHCLGFSNRRNDVIGICGGGGAKSVFVNFENEKFIICDWYCENGLCVREINIDELIEIYWDNEYVRRYLDQIACGITIFAERVAMSITAAV
jgi:hypothetical protein